MIFRNVRWRTGEAKEILRVGALSAASALAFQITPFRVAGLIAGRGSTALAAYGAANRLDDLLDQFRVPPKVFILRMRLVPVIDASGVHALEALLERCQRRGIVLVVSGLQAQPRRVFAQMHLHPRPGMLHIVPGYDAALTLAEELLAGTATEDAPS